MNARVYELLAQLTALGILVTLALFVVHSKVFDGQLTVVNQASSERITPTEIPEDVLATTTPPVVEITASDKGITETNTSVTHIRKDEEAQTDISPVENPYSFAPLDPETLNQIARAALVNILCVSRDAHIKSISGSGVIIDPRGIVLTNAHVAQYILLANHSGLAITCTIRTGAPARTLSYPDIMFFPDAWIREHASSITESRPLGTGEHDYALLHIARPAENTQLPTTFSSIKIDTREGIAYVGDPVLIAGYPAEFGSGNATLYSLYPSTVLTSVRQMMTFSEQLIDMISLGGTALAQSGSSGGAALNYWGYLVGIITTTSEGSTTETRDLRAVTPAHIDRSVRTHLGISLTDLLARDPLVTTMEFKEKAKSLNNTLIAEISKKQIQQ